VLDTSRISEWRRTCSPIGGTEKISAKRGEGFARSIEGAGPLRRII